MDTLEIPRYELMNYLPYNLIEEALELTPYELIDRKNPKKVQEESRINNYLIKKNNEKNKGTLQSLFDLFNFEQEVNKEIKKIMHKQTIFSSLANDLIFEQTEFQIKSLFDADKENLNLLTIKSN